MSAPCSEPFRRLADSLGGVSCDANAVVALRSPTSLENWTLPVVELLMVGGAVLALANALRVRRRTGDPSALALWCAAVVYVLVLEPPLYFPHELGFEEHLDLIFVHNGFSVGFLYDRMPLYIVALYPAGIYLATVLVTRLGVFERRGRVVGATCVGFVHHCFYAPFDHIGPQLRWWAWNPDAAVARPALGSVPLVSTVLFSLVAPALMVVVWRALVAEPAAGGGLRGGAWAWVWRSGATGAATPLLLGVAGAPVSYLMLADDPNETLMAVLLYGTIVGAAAVALPALATGAHTRVAATGDWLTDWYVVAHGGVYLATFAVLWLTALPGLLDAEGGVAPGAGPVGNPLYAAASAAIAAWVVGRAAPAGAGTPAPAEEPALGHSGAG